MPLLPVLRKSPFARLIIFYAAGIATSNYVGTRPVFIFGLAASLILLWMGLLVIVICYKSFKTGWVSGIFAALTLYLCGIWAVEVHRSHESLVHALPDDRGNYKIRIMDLPEIKGSTLKATAKVLATGSGNRGMPGNFRILVYFDNYDTNEMIGPGCELSVYTALKTIPGPSNPDEFNYRKYLAARHIYRHAFVRPGFRKVTGIHRSLRSWSCIMRRQLLFSLEKIGLDPAECGLLSALTLGYKEDLDARTKQIFSRAGVMHIMALSGFNVGIIALVLGFALGIFDYNEIGKAGKTFIIIAFLWLFALVTGLSPSVTRATLMISFVLSGRLFHRPVNHYNVLFASAFIILALSPNMLGDVSFQLSVASVLGIILYQPVLNKLLVFRNRIVNRIWQVFTLTWAAQLATFPLTIYYFHQFPVYFWLTNLYVVPLVSIIVCISCIYLAFAFIGPVAFIIGKVLSLLLKGLSFPVALVEDMPLSLISGIYISKTQVAMLIIMLLSLAIFGLFKMKQWLFVFMVVCISFAALNTLNALKISRQDIIMVGKIRDASAINITRGRQSMLLVGSGSLINDARLGYAFGNFWIRHRVNPRICEMDSASCIRRADSSIVGLQCRTGWRGKNCLVSSGARRMVILRDDFFYRYHSGERLEADLLVITGSLSIQPDVIAKEINPSLIILDSSVRISEARHWQKAFEKIGYHCFSVSENGAYISHSVPDYHR